jgi:hypothetical protein
MNIHNKNQLLKEFTELKEEKKFNLNDLFYRVFKSKEFDDCADQYLIAYLTMRVKLLENRIERLEGYIHGN